MRKLNNKEIFQGKKYLSSNKNYFEGWYFKNSSDGGCISFIPGISINADEKISFIQVITDDNSWIVDYNIDDFEYNDEPFWIRIGNNYFSKERVRQIEVEAIKKLRNFDEIQEFVQKGNVPCTQCCDGFHLCGIRICIRC